MSYFQPGLYYIGDLCYVLNNTDWDEVCDLVIDGNECIGGEFMLTKNFPTTRSFAMYNTKFGDGVYYDQFGNRYSVDSGSIGCIRVDQTTKGKDLEEMKRLGAVVEMLHPFDTCSTEEGLIKIGSTTIDTGGEWNEDEYDYDDEEEVV